MSLCSIFLFKFNVQEGYQRLEIHLSGDKFLAFNVLLYNKSEQKVIGN